MTVDDDRTRLRTRLEELVGGVAPPRRTARGTLAWSALLRVWRHWSLSLLIAVL